MNSWSSSTSGSYSEFDRINLITIQIGEALDVLTDASFETKSKYLDAVKKQEVNEFHFYAMRQGKAYAELTLSIDWDEYNRQLSLGNKVIKVKKKYPKGVLPATSRHIHQFDEYVMNNGFAVKWRFNYSYHIRNNPARVETVRKKLGASCGAAIVKADSFIKFENNEYVYTFDGYGLGELSAKLKI